MREIRLSRPFGWGYWLGCVALLLALNLYAPGEPTVSERVLACVLIALSATTVCVWGRRPSRGIAFMPILIGLSSITYAFPVFLLMPGATLYPFPLPNYEADVDKALLLTIGGLSGMILGYYISWPKLPTVRLVWEDSRAIEIVAWIFGFLSLVAYIVTQHSELPLAIRQPVGLISDVVFLVITVLFILQLQGRLSRWSVLFLWCFLIPTRSMLSMASANLGHVILIGFCLMLTYMTMRHRIPWLMVTIGLLGFCILQPVKGALRQQVWAGGRVVADMSDTSRVESLVDASQRGLQVFAEMGPRVAVSMTFERLSQLTPFVTVTQLTPGTIPYWMGDTYLPLLYKPIPRAIYMDKPDEVLGNAFGHRYGIIAPSDYTTSINLPQLIEFYVNFGPLGILLGGFLIGAFYRIVTDIFVHPGMGLGALAAAIYIASASWLDYEANLSLVIGMLPGLILMLILFHTAIRLISRFLAVRKMYRIQGPYAFTE